MEVFEAKFDYIKQRKDVLSFKKGDKFYIIDKPNEEWWSARKVDDDTFGYVPSIYLEKCKEQFIGRLIPEGRRNTPGAMTKREHDIHLQALSELHQRVKPLPGLSLSKSCPAHVLGQALGVDVPKEPAPPAPHHMTNQRQKILIPDVQVDDPEPISERLRSPPPPLTSPSSRSPRNSFKGDVHSPRGRSPSPQPFPRPKSKNGSFKQEDDSLPYHHKCNAAADKQEEEDDEDELPPHLRSTPPPPVSSPPPPDYDLDYDEDAPNGVPYHHKLNLSGRQESGRFIEVLDDGLEDPHTVPPALIGRVDEDGLIQPKPLHNPVMGSPMHKNLHRELRIRSHYPRVENPGPSNVSGRSVLNKEGNELKKVFRDRSQKQSLKAMEEEKYSRRTSLDVKLGQRLKMAEEEESFKNLETLEKAALQPEFMRMTLKSRSGSGNS